MFLPKIREAGDMFQEHAESVVQELSFEISSAFQLTPARTQPIQSPVPETQGIQVSENEYQFPF